MAAVLITGMSGTGKSTALDELTRRGHAAVDTDHGPWIEVVPQDDGTDEPMWREDRITRLLDDHTGRTLFVGGCVANQGRFYPPVQRGRAPERAGAGAARQACQAHHQ